MDFRRRDRVVTGQNVAGENRQGKRLIAGAVKIAASELIVFIERMIDLPDEAVHVIQRSEEHTSELQSHSDLVCRLLLEKKKKKTKNISTTKYHQEST